MFWRKGTRTRTRRDGPDRGRERPEKKRKAKGLGSESMRIIETADNRPTTRLFPAAPCSAQSMAAKTTEMRMIIKNALYHGWRRNTVESVIAAAGGGKD
jgi:hypothetical protein